VLARQQVMTQVCQPDGGRTGYIVRTALRKGIEGGADTGCHQVVQQSLDRGGLVRIRQW
jgi:hypothetical protein